jgi:hypothetical protein
VRLARCAFGDPLGIALERIPLGLALGEAFPLQQIGQRLIGGPGEVGPETDLPDAVLLEEAQRGAGEAFMQRRQAARCTVIGTQFHNH